LGAWRDGRAGADSAGPATTAENTTGPTNSPTGGQGGGLTDSAGNTGGSTGTGCGKPGGGSRASASESQGRLKTSEFPTTACWAACTSPASFATASHQKTAILATYAFTSSSPWLLSANAVSLCDKCPLHMLEHKNQSSRPYATCCVGTTVMQASTQ
jgi:hypothetical protein